MAEDTFDKPQQVKFKIEVEEKGKPQAKKKAPVRSRSTKKPQGVQKPMEFNSQTAPITDPIPQAQTEEVEVPPSTLDVLTHKEEIFKLLKDNNTEGLLALWGEFKLTPSSVAAERMNIGVTRNALISEGSAFVSEKKGWNLVNSAVLGAGAFQFSNHADIDSCLILSNGAFSGSEDMFDPKTPGVRDFVCENPKISNSVVSGRGVFEYTKKGLIEHSIIKGERALAKSWNMRLVDTYVMGPDGVYYYKDFTFDRFRLSPDFQISKY